MDPDGKKFDKVSRIEAQSDTFEAYLLLDVCTDIYPVHIDKRYTIGLILETVTVVGLTYVMGQRYMQTSKIMPAGLVSGISAVMTMFYAYKVACGGNHFPPPKTE